MFFAVFSFATFSFGFVGLAPPPLPPVGVLGFTSTISSFSTGLYPGITCSSGNPSRINFL
jgi:hypothetical protein